MKTWMQSLQMYSARIGPVESPRDELDSDTSRVLQ